jgi:hypothetical protein
VIWGFNIEAADRNASLDSEEKLAIANTLEKALIERNQLKAGFLTTSLSGLSFLGPSLIHPWTSVSERLKRLTFHLSKLEKAR